MRPSNNVLVFLGAFSTLLAVLLVSRPAAAEEYLKQAELINQKCMSCHQKEGFSTNYQGKNISLKVDFKAYKESAHGALACSSCHPANLDQAPPNDPVYGKELARLVNASCERCHDKAADAYRQSVHGAKQGKDAAASCIDCHGSHGILKKDNPASRIYFSKIPQTCGQSACHAESIKKSYDYSFHGTAVKLGFRRAATCSDCHNAHAILSRTDPRSTVADANIPGTCARCHAKAMPNFAKGTEHVTPRDREKAFPLWLVWKIFLVMVLFDTMKDFPVVILDLVQRLRRASRGRCDGK
ncbi:MAG: hypothetical protein M1598_08210, partial [Actinobacteria bacterium]|nr:hypothetical protein [Actinomycetota bacterium]